MVRDALAERGCAMRGSGDQFNAQCPAHDDRGPSLSVGYAGGKVLLSCKAGCDTTEVLAALGLAMRDLFDAEPDAQRDAAGRPRVVAEYAYRDESGTLLYTVKRYEPGYNGERKTFRPFLPGAERSGIRGARRVLYRLPELRDGIAAGRRVWIVEGEKDVDALARLGEIATCNLNGAGKWRAEYAAAFTGAEVTIVADRDEPGRDHARDVAASLAGVAAAVRIVQPAVTADKADVSDHLAAGYGLADLVPLDAEQEPDGDESDGEWWREVAALHAPLDWFKVWEDTPDDVEWLVEPLIERGRSIVIYSPPKAGKSLLMQEIAPALATGRPVLGNPARAPMSVLYVDLENTTADIRDRLSAMGYGPGDLGNLRYFSFPSLPALDSERGGRELLALAIAYGAELVIIDTVSRVISGGENDADTFNALYRYALAPLKGRGVSVARLDHAGKDAERGQRGSSAKAADVDAVWLLVAKTDTALYLRRQESRTAHGADLISLRRLHDPLRHEVTTEIGSTAARDLAAELDRLGVDRKAGRQIARDALTEAGIRATTANLAEAVRIRKSESWTDLLSGNPADRFDGRTDDDTCPAPVRADHKSADQTCPGQVADSSDSTAAATVPAPVRPSVSLETDSGQPDTPVPDVAPCKRCGEPHHRYGPTGRPCKRKDTAA